MPTRSGNIQPKPMSLQTVFSKAQWLQRKPDLFRPDERKANGTPLFITLLYYHFIIVFFLSCFLRAWILLVFVQNYSFYCAHRKCWVLAKFDSSTYNVDVIVDESSSVFKDNIKFKLNFTKKMDNTKEAYIPFPSTLFGTRLTIMKKKQSIPIGLFIITKV